MFVFMTLHDTPTTSLTHADCLDHGDPDTPCAGDVDFTPSYRGWNSIYPRCDAHYAAYMARNEEREEREAAYRDSLYCVHGTFVGDWAGPDYLCGLCEAWEPSHEYGPDAEI